MSNLPPEILLGIDAEQPDTGPAATVPTQGRSFQQRGRAIVLPAYAFPNEASYAIDIQGEADIVAGTSVTILRFNVPTALKCRVDGMGFGADDDVALRYLVWNLLVGGDQVPAYGAVNANIGSIADLAPIRMPATPGSQVSLVVAMGVAAIQTYHIIARLTGWLYVEAS